MPTASQKQTAQAIINIFETGSVRGDYGNVTVVPEDPGHLTFGRSQTTLASGNLSDLIQAYCDNPGARFGARMAPLLPRLLARDLTLDEDFKFHNVLRASADDPVMRDTQDAFFDRVYWDAAIRQANAIDISGPLCVTVVYDSVVHGSWRLIRDRVNQNTGPVSAVGEETWCTAYVDARRAWLASHPNKLLRKTVYRMDALRRLIDQGQWGLPLPLVVREQEISTATLAALPPNSYDGPQPGTRLLAAQAPLPRGLDVRLIQLALSDDDRDIKCDAVFGSASAKCVREYQAANGLPVTGVVDVALVHRLLGT